MRWQNIIKLDDQGLQAKGVAALGARRKMLKVFENVREHCKKNVSCISRHEAFITLTIILSTLSIKTGHT